MANTKTTQLPELTVIQNEDWIYVIDKSDLTDGLEGTSKKISKFNLSLNGAQFIANTEIASYPTGDVYTLVTEAKTYTDWGGIVVGANKIAILMRIDGVFSSSQNTLVLTDYVLKTDVVNTLVSTETEKPLSAAQGKALNEKNIKIEPWTAKSYLSGDQVNYLGKDWVSNATIVAGDVPGTSSKWVERLSSYSNSFFATKLSDANEVIFNSIVKDLKITGTPTAGFEYVIEAFYNNTNAQFVISKTNGTLTSVINIYKTGRQYGIESLYGYEEANSGHKIALVIDWDKLYGTSTSGFSYKNLNQKKIFTNDLSVQNKILLDEVVFKNVTQDDDIIAFENRVNILEDNVAGNKVPLITKVAATTSIDFTLATDGLAIGVPFFVRCRNANGTIPPSVNWQIRDSSTPLQGGTLTLDANGEGTYTIIDSPANINTTIFRLVNITTDFTASIISDSTTIDKRIESLETEMDLKVGYDDIMTFENRVNILEDNVAGNKVPLITKVATTGSIDFDINGVEIETNKSFFVKCVNANGTIPTSVNYSNRDINLAFIAQGTIALDTNGEGVFTVTYQNAAFFRLQNIITGFTATILQDKQTVGKRLDFLDSEIPKIKFYKQTFDSNLIMNEGEIYDSCVFENIDVRASNYNIISNCDFVNSPLLPKNFIGIKHTSVLNNKFIGQFSFINMGQIINCKINFNEFLINDSRYPSAVERDRGQFSINLKALTFNSSEFIGNRIYKGRTGFLQLSDNVSFRDNSLDEYSSNYNIITNNIIEGCGEEYISFDGQSTYDVGQITDASVTFEERTINQMINGQEETTSQTKIVALLDLNITSQTQGLLNYIKSVKNYPAILKGIYGVGLKNSKYYKVVAFSLIGETEVDTTDGIEYAVNGTYKVTLELPTRYTYKNMPMTGTQVVDTSADIISEFSVNDLIYVGSVSSKNSINNNTINGIGTDTIYDVSDMGGIVMYGVCLNNVISGNTLNQRRIWFQGWNVSVSEFISKIKIQSFNVISHNIINDSYISFVNLLRVGYGNSMLLNRGNRVVGNVVSGLKNVSGIHVDKHEDLLLMGNISSFYDLKNSNKIKLVANTKEFTSVLSNNTNVVVDVTDEITT